MSFPKYPRYKDSGVEWLGEVPEHWVKGNLKWLASLYSGGTPDRTNEDYWSEGTIPWIGSGEVNQSIITEPTEFISDLGLANSSAKWVPSGALVMALAGQGKTKGMVAQMGISATCNQSMAAIVPTPELHSRFLFWWLSANYQRIRNLAGGDLRDGLNLDLLGGIVCPLPKWMEQRAIAQFLDRETTKIDALIAEQQRLIALLKEKRQSVISHAVTKGLDPHAPMKPSGIEWLGDVPAHWEIWKLSHAFETIGSGTTPKSDDLRFYDNGNIPWVNTGELCDGGLSGSTKYVTPMALEEYTSLQRYPAGSLVIAMYGATIGKLGLLEFSATVNQACCVFSGASAISVRFLFYWFLGFREQLVSLASGGGQPNISQEILRSLRVAAPTETEQAKIVSFLDGAAALIDGLTAGTERAITLLQERRTALISAAVTGKIDVRGLAEAA